MMIKGRCRLFLRDKPVRPIFLLRLAEQFVIWLDEVGSNWQAAMMTG